MTKILNKLSAKPWTLAFVLILMVLLITIRLFPGEDALWLAVVIVATRIYLGEAP